MNGDSVRENIPDRSGLNRDTGARNGAQTVWPSADQLTGDTFRAILEAAPDAIVLVDERGCILFLNRQAEALFAYRREELIGCPVEILLPERHRDTHSAQRACYLASPRPRPIGTGPALHGRRKDGSEFAAEISLSPVQTADGRFIISTIRDISERKRAEDQMRRAVARYRTLVEQIPAITFVAPFESGDQELYVSPQIETLLGFTQREWLDDPVLWFRQLHPDDQERWNDEFAPTCAEGKPFRSVYRFIARDGRVVWVHGEAQLVRDEEGRGLSLQGVAFDITAIKRAEERLQQLHADLEQRVEERTAELVQANEALAHEVAERRHAEESLSTNEAILRSFYDSVPLMLGVVEVHSNDIQHVSVNKAAAAFFDLAASARPREAVVQRRVAADSRHVWLTSCCRAAASTGPLQFEYLYQQPGRERWLSATICSIPTAPELPPRLSYVIEDVTERKRVAEELRQAQKMEAIGRLAGGVAHDFNNLLTVINGFCELLLTQGSLAEFPRSLVKEINTAGRRAAELTQHLLAFGRRQTIRPQVLDLNHVVTEAEKMLQRVIGEDVVLEVRLAAVATLVFADKGQLSQVLLNLAVNARDAMPQGGRLILETRRVDCNELTGGSGRDGKPGPYAVLTVTDTGCGMTAETQAHLFEPFFTTKEVGKGTGLGLASVYGVVAQAEGYIEVESEPGRGSTFRIYLPRVGDSIPTEARESSVSLTRGRETILLAEDEPGVRALARQALHGMGYTVLTAADGSEALRICQDWSGEIHLLITDVIMPGMSGRQLAECLSLLRPGMRILYVSGYPEEQLGPHGVLDASAEFLAKPYTPTSLGTRVRAVLDRVVL